MKHFILEEDPCFIQDLLYIEEHGSSEAYSRIRAFLEEFFYEKIVKDSREGSTANKIIL